MRLDHRREFLLRLLELLRELLLVVGEELVPGFCDLEMCETTRGDDDGEERGAWNRRGQTDLPRGRLPDDEIHEIGAGEVLPWDANRLDHLRLDRLDHRGMRGPRVLETGGDAGRRARGFIAGVNSRVRGALDINDPD